MVLVSNIKDKGIPFLDAPRKNLYLLALGLDKPYTKIKKRQWRREKKEHWQFSFLILQLRQ